MNDTQAQYIGSRIAHATYTIGFAVTGVAALMVLALSEGNPQSAIITIGLVAISLEFASMGFAHQSDGWNRRFWEALKDDHAPYLDEMKDEIEGETA